MYEITCEPIITDGGFVENARCDHCEDHFDTLFALYVAGKYIKLCRECLTNVASAVHPFRLSFTEL